MTSAVDLSPERAPVADSPPCRTTVADSPPCRIHASSSVRPTPAVMQNRAQVFEKANFRLTDSGANIAVLAANVVSINAEQLSKAEFVSVLLAMHERFQLTGHIPILELKGNIITFHPFTVEDCAWLDDKILKLQRLDNPDVISVCLDLEVISSASEPSLYQLAAISDEIITSQSEGRVSEYQEKALTTSSQSTESRYMVTSPLAISWEGMFSNREATAVVNNFLQRILQTFIPAGCELVQQTTRDNSRVQLFCKRV